MLTRIRPTSGLLAGIKRVIIKENVGRIYLLERFIKKLLCRFLYLYQDTAGFEFGSKSLIGKSLLASGQ